MKGFKIDHEVETRKILEDQEYANLIDQQFGITKFQLEALRLLSTDDSHQMTDMQKKLADEFVRESIGNLAVNSKLKAMLGMRLIDTGLNREIIGRFAYFTFKTRRADQFPKIYDKVNKNQDRINKGMELNEKDKISLKEYSIFSDMAKTKTIFDFLKKKIGYEEEALYQKIANADSLSKQMEEAYSSSVKVAPGMLVFDDTKKKSQVTGKVLSTFQNIIRKVITKHHHASKLYENKNGEATLSHINPEARDDKFKLRDYLYSNIYQIKIEKLISKENKKVLQEKYEDEWRDVVNETYAKIEKEIHDNTVEKFGKLEGQTKRAGYKAGVSSLVPFGLGHRKIKTTDFSEIRKRVVEKHYKENKGNMICSEFVAYTTIAALMELNDGLEKDTGIKDIIKIPISKHENIHRILPERLLSVLKKAGCVEKIQHPIEVKRYFKK